MGQVMELAKSSKVELMAHPVIPAESDYLMDGQFRAMLDRLNTASYALV
jgi:hypothetical protein